MDYVLSQKLPPELVDIICKKVHRLNMEKVFFQIKHCVVWVRINGKQSFWSCNNSNYYRLLDEDWEVWVRSQSRNDRLDLFMDLFD